MDVFSRCWQCMLPEWTTHTTHHGTRVHYPARTSKSGYSGLAESSDSPARAKPRRQTHTHAHTHTLWWLGITQCRPTHKRAQLSTTTPITLLHTRGGTRAGLHMHRNDPIHEKQNDNCHTVGGTKTEKAIAQPLDNDDVNIMIGTPNAGRLHSCQLPPPLNLRAASQPRGLWATRSGNPSAAHRHRPTNGRYQDLHRRQCRPVTRQERPARSRAVLHQRTWARRCGRRQGEGSRTRQTSLRWRHCRLRCWRW